MDGREGVKKMPYKDIGTLKGTVKGHDIEIRDLKKKQTQIEKWIANFENDTNKEFKEVWKGVNDLKLLITTRFTDMDLSIQGLRDELNKCLDLDKQKEYFENQLAEKEKQLKAEYEEKLREIKNENKEKNDLKHKILDRRWVQIGIIITILIGFCTVIVGFYGMNGIRVPGT